MRKPLPGRSGSLEIVYAAADSQSSTSSRIELQDVAPLVIAERFGLSLCLARVVVELAHLGGRLS
jgi:hypothetical protein